MLSLESLVFATELSVSHIETVPSKYENTTIHDALFFHTS